MTQWPNLNVLKELVLLLLESLNLFDDAFEVGLDGVELFQDTCGRNTLPILRMLQSINIL